MQHIAFKLKLLPIIMHPTACSRSISLVLIRHGESLWNYQNKFTGWTDIILSNKGKLEIAMCAEWIYKSNIQFQIGYTSVLSRAIQSMNIITDQTNHHHIPVIKSWRLNERHYGQLQGLNKDEMIKKFGFNNIHLWTSTYDVGPPEINWEDERNPHREEKYKFLLKEQIPLGEVFTLLVIKANSDTNYTTME